MFGEILEQPGDAFVNVEFDGIVGLGFPALSVTDKRLTMVDRLKKQNCISSRVFCFNLNEKNDKTGSEVIFGGCDVKAEFFLPLTRVAYWQFLLTSIEVVPKSDNIRSFMACKNGCQAIMDTGTSLITGPKDEIKIINDMLGAELNKRTAEYHINCNKKGLPNIIFNLQGHKITLTPADYIVRYSVRINILIAS